MHNINQINNIVNKSQKYSNDLNNWNETIAIQIAKLEGIQLQPIHWKIIYFVRMFYAEYKMFPKIRTLINIIALTHGSKIGNSRYLIKLFPNQSVIQQIAKIAGLPKPNQCI